MDRKVSKAKQATSVKKELKDFKVIKKIVKQKNLIRLTNFINF
jgi:hypothetical protein